MNGELSLRRLYPKTILIPAVLLLLCAPPPLQALWGNSVTGYAELSGVSSETDDIRNSNLRQQYTVSFLKRVTPYMSLRSSLRYYKLDLAQGQSPDVWQEEWQPSGEFSWTPPWFNFSTNLRRRNSQSSTLATRLRSDLSGFSFRTRSSRFPVLTLRYDLTRVRESGPDANRKSDEKRFQSGLQYTAGRHSFSEGFTRGQTRNLISSWESLHDLNNFRWSYAVNLLEDKRLHISSNYTHNYRHQLDRVQGSATILNVIPVVSALYAADPGPEWGQLEPLPQLSDGNVDDPTQPQVDLGTGSINRNIGVDFGFARPVGALYIFLDAASGPLTWQVYTSSDNLNWSRLEEEVEVVLNLGYNRFELLFPTVTTRYIKAVNGGLNEATTVHATEIQAFIQSEPETTTESFSQSHFVDLAIGYRFSERLNTSLSGTYQQEPLQGLDGDRRNQFYSMSTRFRQTEMISHTVNFHQSFQDFAADSSDLKSLSGGYNLLVAPLTTLDFLLSISRRIGYYGSGKDQESGNALLAVHGSPFTNLHLIWESGFSRQIQYAIYTASETWTHRLTANSALTRRLDAGASLRFQSSQSMPADSRHLRRQFQLNLNYRATNTIFIRGATDINMDETVTYTQDFLFSWNATAKVKMGLQTYLTGDEGGARTSRFNTNINYKLGTRSTIFFGFSLLDYRPAGGARTANLQAGLRTGF